jgi:hypothetical protein
MNKLYVFLMFIALVACVACQRQQPKERKNAEIEREMQERASAEHQAQDQQQVTQHDSSASPGTSPEKPYALKSQAQKFQPRRIVPMTSPIRETPTSRPTSSEPLTEKLNKNETENQKGDRKEAVQAGEGLPRLPSSVGESSPVQVKVPQAILDPILKEAAASANVDRGQVVIVRAESVVWNDGSLGCPEPGMMYTQALVNGYWIVVEAAGKKYDFRAGSGGSLRLCPPGQGQPPSQPAAN